ncbi:MAG: response regulator, partial [Proteobacteria bacterium]
LGEAKGLPVSKVFPIINIRTRQPALDPIGRVIREGQVVGLANHTALIARNGHEIVIEDSAAPIRDLSGAITGVVLVFRDVTEKVALEEKSELLNAVIESSKDFIGIARPDGSAYYVNPAGRRLMGLSTLEDVSKTKIFDYFVPEERARVLEEIIPEIQEKGSWDGRVLFQNFKTKEPIPISWNAFSVADVETGGIAAIACVSKDLRDAERRQEILDAEQKKLLHLLTQMPIGVCLLEGPDHRFTFANPRYYDLFQGERSLVGKTVLEALPELTGSPLPGILDAVYRTGTPFYGNEFAVDIADTSGNLRSLFLNFAYEPMRGNRGNIYGISVTVTDVTESVQGRKVLEQKDARLSVALIAGDIGTWDLDTVSRELVWSKRGAEMYGFFESNVTSYETFLARVHPEDRARVDVNVRASTVANGQSRYDLLYRIVLPNGKVRTIKADGLTAFEEVNGSQEPVLFTGTVIDVTEQIEAREAVLVAKNLAESANSAKSAFLANMSHEIRTPLGAIMGFAELLKNPRLGKTELTNFTAVIERNSHHLLRIVDDILDLSKVESGKMLFESIEILVPAFLADISSLFGFKAREKGVAFDLRFVNAVPETVMSDPTRLRQIVTNMVGNAIKFTSRGSVELAIEYAKGKLFFKVKDTGRGISEEQAGKLFQAFSQADESTTREFGGTGLGLILTRRLASAMGGDFILESSVLGEGSIFVASVAVEILPGTKMVSASRAYAPELSTGLDRTDRLSSKRLLVVDDSPDNRTLISVILGEQGALVDLASDGYLALEHALANSYDLVFLDIQMPGMDGYQALKLLRDKHPNLPVIAITAHAMAEERARAKSAGFTDFITKPVHRETLIRSAEAVFRGGRKEQPDSTCDVLIVEDDQDIRDLFGQVLDMNDFSFLSAANGKDAIGLLEQANRPRLILLDLSLPDIPGADVIAQIRSNSNWRNFNVVIVSGWDQLDERARKLGADGSLKKPVEIEVLEKLLAEFLAR